MKTAKRMIALVLVLLTAISIVSTFMGCGLFDGDTNHSRFTNKYGTSTTKCHHPGCDNYIASSGDTNCCTKHSRRCLECGCYIDEDAIYCMDCISKALDH